MQETFLTQKNAIIALVVVCILVGGGYYGYTFFTEDPLASSSELDTSSLDPNLVAFINAKNKINLKRKDITFLNPGFAADIYSTLIDHTETIPMTDSRGRPDPFIPYATTGPIR